MVYAYSEWAYVNTDTGLPEKNVPQKEFEAYGITEPLNKEFARGKIRVPDEAELCSGEPVIVTEHHLDTVLIITCSAVIHIYNLFVNVQRWQLVALIRIAQV